MRVSRGIISRDIIALCPAERTSWPDSDAESRKSKESVVRAGRPEPLFQVSDELRSDLWGFRIREKFGHGRAQRAEAHLEGNVVAVAKNAGTKSIPWAEYIWKSSDCNECKP